MEYFFSLEADRTKFNYLVLCVNEIYFYFSNLSIFRYELKSLVTDSSICSEIYENIFNIFFFPQKPPSFYRKL